MRISQDAREGFELAIKVLEKRLKQQEENVRKIKWVIDFLLSEKKTKTNHSKRGRYIYKWKTLGE